MNTPIADFVKNYADSDISRFHMPGHKGKSFIGCEPLDITEITGADVLYGCNGIIKESEDNLSSLFGTAHSYFSTEGSTLCIKAMLALVTQGRKRPFVLALRNIHKAFCYAAALLDIEVDFVYSDSTHLCSCEITPKAVEDAIGGCKRKPDALYITSPDYLGYIPDIKEISDVCKKYGIPLLCDNAHGAYLKFLPVSQHPIDLGATLCCDSAHKTLPVLTGGAYLHISKDAPAQYMKNARNMLSLFASTSPSYLIMQSLDLCNKYIAEGYAEKLLRTYKTVNECKKKILGMGYYVKESEPLKIVAEIEGADLLCAHLRENNIECEFCDSRYLVLMASTENSARDFERLLRSFASYKGERSVPESESFINFRAQRVMSIRKAMLSQSETVSVKDAIGRVCASPTVSCPPAVPIAVSGEKITEAAAELFKSYGIDEVSVVK